MLVVDLFSFLSLVARVVFSVVLGDRHKRSLTLMGVDLKIRYFALM